MAVVDANLNFIFIDVGAHGREADSNVFRQSVFGKKLYTNQLQIPDAVSLPLTENNSQPFVFVADKAFGLHTNLLRPYPGRGLNNTRRIFNYRLSRARLTVECAFGILANKWNVLHTTILVEPDFCDHIIKAYCVLHNFVRKRDGCNYYENIADTAYINYLEDFQGHGRRHINQNGMEIRDNFANYFINQGAVSFLYRTTL
ncbi:uncharacterized protein LOC132925656 [Rhopalosiphum padi]|uniref:uncharacterized protein LOC132925656 n=1 Tax=Rhopalosiphum padi TaxID=40932 RepID=UPI00298DF972|nr:uncharacterized protein LOC132925656 [Rhopalosiphum padi]